MKLGVGRQMSRLAMKWRFLGGLAVLVTVGSPGLGDVCFYPPHGGWTGHSEKRDAAGPLSIRCSAIYAIGDNLESELRDRFSVRFGNQKFSSTADGRPLFNQRLSIDFSGVDAAEIPVDNEGRTKAPMQDIEANFRDYLCNSTALQSFVSAKGVLVYTFDFHFRDALPSYRLVQNVGYVRISSCKETQ